MTDVDREAVMNRAAFVSGFSRNVDKRCGVCVAFQQKLVPAKFRRPLFDDVHASCTRRFNVHRSQNPQMSIACGVTVAERLREIANIANLVAKYFKGDASKVSLWFELPNPMFGHVSPAVMIRGNRCRRLLNFVLEAREAEMGSLDTARKRA